MKIHLVIYFQPHWHIEKIFNSKKKARKYAAKKGAEFRLVQTWKLKK